MSAEEVLGAPDGRRLAERLRISQAVAGVGAFEYAAGEEAASVTPQFCKLLGLASHGRLPLIAINALVEGGGELISAWLGAPTAVELLIRRADDGELRWIVRSFERADEAHGQPRWVGAIYDVTAVKVAEAELRRLNEELEARVAERTRERDRTWRLAPVMMVVADAEGRLQNVNPAWSQVLGWSEAEVVGRRVTEFVCEEDHGALAAGVAALMEGAPSVELVLRVVTRSGQTRRILWTAVQEGGRLYTFGRDTTDQAETEEKLRQAQKMEAVGQLTGGIAHDFNNLLTGIVGSLDLLQSRLIQGRIETLPRYIQAAQASAGRAAALTHRLLAFSRRQPLQPVAVDANTLITGMEELLRRTLSERVRLEIVTAGALWPTLCDPNQLENAVLNLAINARAAMPEGGRLTLETCNIRLDEAYTAHSVGVEPGEYVCLSVTDTGEGMTPEERDGANIYCRVPLPMTQAALGGDVEVPAIDGTRAKVKIPAGTQTADQFRLRGKGFSILRSAARGDMYIQVAVETPAT